MRTARLAFAALFAAAVVQGCGEDKTAVVNPVHTHSVATVQVQPATLALEEGETFELSATSACECGEAVDAEITWRSAKPAVATVDADGIVTAVLEGTAEILAEADGPSGTVTGKATLEVDRQGELIDASGGTVSYLNGAVVLEIPAGALSQPTKITIRPATADIVAERPDMVGGTAYHFRPEGLQLQAQARLTIRYENGNVPAGVHQDRLRFFHRTEAGWSELVTSEVDPVAGTVSALVDGFSHYDIEESELPTVDRVVIGGTSSEPVAIGATLQLTATLYDAGGNTLEYRRVTWASNDESLASVDQTGLVSTYDHGRVTITATSEGVTGSAELLIAGEPTTEEAGNNMSWPVVFVDGVGLTGQPVSTDPGVRPTADEGITVDTLPFFWEGNTTTYGDYYEQQTASTWRAEYVDGSAQAPFEASAYWGDNLTVREWKAGNPIRVEIALSATNVGTLTGFEMTLLYGSETTEMQGTDGSTAEFVPLIYTVGPTFVVETLDGQGGAVTETVVNTTIGSEVNVSGRTVYGYQLDVATEGWYRLRFLLAEGARVNLTAVGNGGELMFVPTIVNAKETALEVHVTAD